MQVGIWLVVLTVLALSQARELVFVNPDGGIDNFHEALRTYRRIGTSVNTFISHFLSGTANGTEKLTSVSFPNVSALCLEQMFGIASQINPSQPPPEWIIRCKGKCCFFKVFPVQPLPFCLQFWMPKVMVFFEYGSPLYKAYNIIIIIVYYFIIL